MYINLFNPRMFPACFGGMGRHLFLTLCCQIYNANKSHAATCARITPGCSVRVADLDHRVTRSSHIKGNVEAYKASVRRDQQGLQCHMAQKKPVVTERPLANVKPEYGGVLIVDCRRQHIGRSCWENGAPRKERPQETTAHPNAYRQR